MPPSPSNTSSAYRPNREIAWSPGTRVTSPSTRFASEEPALVDYGVARDSLQEPYSGLTFLQRFSFTKDQLSISEVLSTDREWSVGRASLLIVKGTVDLEVIQEALQPEGLYPIQCHIKGDGHNKALASIWINKLYDSVCGAYHEYVISFDVHKSQPNRLAFDSSLYRATYACWYNNFVDSVCEAQFLHSLYINSPLSITWGREMQAFPKHPIPVQSVIDLNPHQKVQSCEMKWDDDTLLNLSTERNFGTSGFLQEGLGLVATLGGRKVLQFLGDPVFSSHIVMPQKTAAQANCARDYTAYIWKGLNPMAVKLWPWNPETDTLSLGTITKETGCEAHNGIALLKKANFRPLSVCSIDKLSAVVTLRNS